MSKMLHHLGLSTRMVDHKIVRIIERGSEYLTSRNVSPRYYALFMFGDGSMLLVAVPALFHRLQWGGSVPQYV